MKKISSISAHTIILMLVLSMIIVAPLTHAAGATIWTDKPDYCPEETVTISGSVFLASATVTVAITRPDSTIDTIYALTDESGAFSCTYQLNGITGTYAVTATDGTNTATTTFTDRTWSVSVSPTGATVSQGGSTTATVTVSAVPTGGPEVGLWATGQPSGVTISFSPTSGTPYFTSTMSVTVDSATTPGVYPINISVFTGQPGYPSYSEKARTTYTLTVTGPATVSITITSSSVTGLGFVEVDGSAITTPTTFTWTIGSTHTLAALSPVSDGTGIQYVWTSWSDGGNQIHTYTVPSTSRTVTANYKTQYYLTVVSPYDTAGGMGWYDSGTNAYATLTNGVVSGGAGVQYVFTGWSSDASGIGLTSDPILMDGPKTATANWKTQYYLTVVSLYDTPGGAGWYDSGTTAYATLATGTVDIVPGSVRAVFTGWSGDANGTGLTSDPITLNGPKNAIANWEIQYYLTVVTDPSKLVPIPGEDWYANCTWVRLTAPQYVPSEAGLNGVRYSFTFWDVDGTSQGTGVNPIDVHMDAPHIATAHFVLQYYLTVQTSPQGVDSPTGEGWYDAGTYAPISTDQYFDIVPGSSRYNFTGWATTDMSEIVSPSSPSTTVLMDKAKTVTANYVTQYYITFAQTGVGSDFTGTVVIIDGTGYDRNDASFWWDSGSTHSFAFQSPLIVPPGAKQYDWDSTTGLSSLQSDPINVTGSGGVTGNYVTRVHDVAVTDLVAIVRHCKWGNGTWVFQGRPVNFTVTVENNGDFDETVAVTLYYNITANKIVGTQSVPLLMGESKTLLFVWDTTSVPYCHNYTITAVATIMPADYTPADNTLDNVYVKVRIMGDLNGDGSVDGSDIVLAAWSFASYGPNYRYPGSPPSPRWNLDCDINEDLRIDGIDLVLICRNWGMCAP
jgi:uncharacterized repeat protein (TIGR02543 family)